MGILLIKLVKAMSLYRAHEHIHALKFFLRNERPFSMVDKKVKKRARDAYRRNRKGK